jgi:hypothetical protein
MALAWVKVVRSDGGGAGDDVYVDGNYVDAAGVLGTPFRTQTGQNTFETADPAWTITWQKTIVVDKPAGNAKADPVLVTLDPAP